MNLPPCSQRTRDFDVARTRLSRFIERKARDITRVTGVNYEERSDAPETFSGVTEAWAKSVASGLPFPVFSGGSDKTIYEYPAANWAFRFWHDFLHLKHNRGLGHEDEVFIGQLHVQEVVQEFGRGSLEARLMFADTVGQSLYYELFSDFVEDQLAFARHLVESIGTTLSILPPKGNPAVAVPLTDSERSLLAA